MTYRPLLSTPKESLSTYVRKHCRAKKISLDKLAEQAGIARSTLYHLLEENSVPKIPHLLALATAMGVHHYFLFRLKWREFDHIELPCAASQKIDLSGFIEETIPDGTLVMTGSHFEKSWTIQNIGEVVWENRYFMHLDAPYHHIKHYPNGQSLADYQFLPDEVMVPLPVVYPKQTYTFKMGYTAPNIAGRYISYWQMVDENGEPCFPDGVGLSVSVLVKSFGSNRRS